MYCRNCGNEVNPQQRFCPKCGNKVGHPSEPGVNQQQGKRRWPKVVIFTLSILVIAFLSTFLVLRFTSKGMWLATKCTRQKVVDGGETIIDGTSSWTYDECGNIQLYTNDIKQATVDGDATEEYHLSESYRYAVDEEGRCISSKGEATSSSTSSTSPTTIEVNQTFTCEEDSSGKTMTVQSTWDNEDSDTYEYEYNEQGFIGVRTVRHESGGVSVEYFDLNGNVTKTIHDTNSLNEEITYTYEYDLLGRAKSCSAVTINPQTGKTVRTGEEVFTYDRHGNMVSEVFSGTYYNDDGSTSYATDTYTYEYEYIKNPSPWVYQIRHLDFGRWRIY